MASIKTLQAFTISVDGELESFAYNTVYDVDSDMASELIEEGLAESYGGGGGDFTVATMTVSVESGLSVEITGAMQKESDGQGYTAYYDYVETDSVINIIMYGNGAMVELGSENTLNVSGNIQFVEDSVYAVTGDCTVSVTGK